MAAPGIFALTGLGPGVSALGVTFLRTVCRGAPFLVLSMALSGVLRAHGDTRTPMLFAVLVNGLNILGDYALIFGNLGFPALGVRGSALASSTAQIVGATLFVVLFFTGRLKATARLADVFRPRREAMAGTVRLAVPASLESLFTDLARTVGVFAVASLGAVSVAAHEVTSTREALSFMPGFGFAVAASVLVGQSLGRRDPAKAEAAVGEAARLSLLFMGGLGVLFFCFPATLVSIFTNDQAIFAVAAKCLRVTALAQPLMALQGVLSGALRGAGDTRSPMLVAGATSWGCRVALTFVVVFALGRPLPWVWAVMVVDWAVKLVLLLAVYRRGRWRAARV